MPDAYGLQEALLAERQRDEVAKLDELRLGEVLMQAAPEIVVGQAGIPGDGHRPGERGALTVVELLRVLEVQDVVDLRFRGALFRGEYRTLAAAVLAVDGLGDVEAAELLDRVVVTPWRKKASQATLNAFITGGLCSRIAWLSGRGVPYRRARSRPPSTRDR